MHNDLFFQERDKFVQSDEGKKVIEEMNTKNYNLAKTYFPPELWEEHGERMNEYMGKAFYDFVITPDSWLFSTIDVFSNIFLLKLAFMGFHRVSAINVMRNFITKYGKNGEGKYKHYLEYSIAAVLTANRVIDIYVFEDGTTELVEYNEGIATAERSVVDSHVVIPVKTVLQRLLWHEDLRTPNGKSLEMLLNPELNRIILDFTKDTNKITVHLKNGNVDIIERETRVDLDKRIGETLTEHDYQDITVKKRKGKTVSVTRKTTEKFK